MDKTIQIGDYVTVDTNGEPYRCYITKIETDKITVVEMNNPKITRQLIKKNGLWQVATYTIPSDIKFIKNDKNTRYYERDFTLTPSNIIIIAEKSELITEFIDLQNGIILHMVIDYIHTGTFKFTDTNNCKYPSINSNKCDEATTFLESFLSKSNKITSTVRPGDGYETFFISDEIFVWNFVDSYIAKLDLNTMIFIEYDNNSEYYSVHPLKNRKMLCILDDYSMYILDLTKRTDNRQKITIVNPLGLRENLSIKQLSDGDIIVGSFMDSGGVIKYYRIKDNILDKLATFDKWYNILAILPDNKILLQKEAEGSDLITHINLWDITSGIQTGVFSLKTLSNNMAIGESLHNGDVLFYLDGNYYLFTYIDRKIIELPLFLNEYSSKIGYIKFKQLKNGNIIINNGNYLAVMEFPVTQKEIDRKNYDEITPDIQLNSDMLALVRTYL